eukprot:GHVU01020209.1.p1 GENE.GHVU01020209.1~~GHVU01020209.1.p1  ORF type:complete len:567 (-),score=68.86 GHVU01020209.1:33-1553(-)
MPPRAKSARLLGLAPPPPPPSESDSSSSDEQSEGHVSGNDSSDNEEGGEGVENPSVDSSDGIAGEEEEDDDGEGDDSEDEESEVSADMPDLNLGVEDEVDGGEEEPEVVEENNEPELAGPDQEERYKGWLIKMKHAVANGDLPRAARYIDKMGRFIDEFNEAHGLRQPDPPIEERRRAQAAGNNRRPDRVQAVRIRVESAQPAPGPRPAGPDLALNHSDKTKYKISFEKGTVSTSTLLPLSPFHSYHMQRMDMPTPLSAFMKAALEAGLIFTVQSGNSSKKKELAGSYAPSEYWLCYADWDRTLSLKAKYFIEVFGMAEWGGWLLEHKENVKKVFDDTGVWIIAFRYCQLVRNNVIMNPTYKLINNEWHRIPGDPSVFREDLLKKAKEKTEQLKDGMNYRKDNPYAKDGPRERFNPMTGVRYLDGYDHDTLDELAMLNEFSGNKVPVNRTKTSVNANKRNDAGNGDTQPNKRTRRGWGSKSTTFQQENAKKNNDGNGPVAGSSKDK